MWTEEELVKYLSYTMVGIFVFLLAMGAIGLFFERGRVHSADLHYGQSVLVIDKTGFREPRCMAVQSRIDDFGQTYRFCYFDHAYPIVTKCEVHTLNDDISVDLKGGHCEN